MTDRGKIVKRIIDGLETIAGTKVDDTGLARISSTAEDLLFAFYKAGVSGISFTPEEKQTIGALVPPALQGLGYRLSDLQISFSSESTDSVRIQRSGLQFFIDTFKDCSVGTSETLSKTLDEFVEREDVDGLDKCLKNVVFDFLTDDGRRSSVFQAEIAKLPSTHWWFID